MKKPSWSVWFPYPSSWLSAFILAVLMNAIIFIVKMTGIVGYFLAKLVDSPELLVVFGILALLSPIAAIAFAHHLFHHFLSRFIPGIQAPEIAKSQGLLPGLISWWKGLYGWLVIVLATLIAIILCTILLPLFNLSYEKINYSYSQAGINLEAIITGIWIVNAATLYQIEYLVKRRLIFANSVGRQHNKSRENIDSDIDTRLNQLRGEMGLNKMKKKGKSA